jgi:hypothetical protein
MVAADEIARSPAWFPLEPVADRSVRLVRLDEAAYRAESFLDQRILGRGYPEQSCALTTLQSAAAQLRPRAHYIFHIGHVGSTLLSRLVGEHAGCFSLREPALLRLLAAPPAPAAPDLDLVLALLARTWRPGQRAVVKVTSFAGELAERILAAGDRPAAIFMFVPPESYLRTVLAGPNSRLEARQLAPARLRRLERRLGQGDWHPDPQSEGEHLAMSWLCEMLTLHQAAARFGPQVLWLSFDEFLGEPAPSLASAFRALGIMPAPGEIAALVTGPLMRQYSKAPEHVYDARLRRELLRAAGREHPLEIRRALDWLARVAQRQPLAAAVLESSLRAGQSAVQR